LLEFHPPSPFPLSLPFLEEERKGGGGRIGVMDPPEWKKKSRLSYSSPPLSFLLGKVKTERERAGFLLFSPFSLFPFFFFQKKYE